MNVQSVKTRIWSDCEQGPPDGAQGDQWWRRGLKRYVSTFFPFSFTHSPSLSSSFFKRKSKDCISSKFEALILSKRSSPQLKQVGPRKPQSKVPEVSIFAPLRLYGPHILCRNDDSKRGWSIYGQLGSFSAGPTASRLQWSSRLPNFYRSRFRLSCRRLWSIRFIRALSASRQST